MFQATMHDMYFMRSAQFYYSYKHRVMSKITSSRFCHTKLRRSRKSEVTWRWHADDLTELSEIIISEVKQVVFYLKTFRILKGTLLV